MLPGTSSRKPAQTAATELAPCAVRSRSTSKTPLSEALIQGVLPRPSELDIYLGDMGIYYRVANQPEPVAVTAGDGEPEAEPMKSPGIPLYNF